MFRHYVVGSLNFTFRVFLAGPRPINQIYVHLWCIFNSI